MPVSIQDLVRASATKWMPSPPASEDAIARLVADAECELPRDYLEFLRVSNGGCGEIPVQPWCFDRLWKAEDLVTFNCDYEVERYCPGFFGIGGSGGGEMFAFDMRNLQPWPVVVIPFIGMEAAAALQIALDFRSFVELFGKK